MVGETPRPSYGPELRRLNIERFQQLRVSTTDESVRRRLEQLIQDERNKPDTAYPVVQRLSPTDAAEDR